MKRKHFFSEQNLPIQFGLKTLLFLMGILAFNKLDAQTTLLVTNTDDSGPGSLRQAVEDANNLSSSDTIRFDLVTYPALIQLNSSITISDDLFIIGNKNTDTVKISGQNTTRIFEVSATNATLENIALVNGYNADFNGDYTGGGAILSADSDLTLNSCYFQYNSSNYGGAIKPVNGNLTINNCYFINNTVTNYGGAIQIGYTTTTINSSEFINNVSDDKAGAIYSYYANLTINESKISYNTANNNGGALFQDNGFLNINNSGIENNTTNFGTGGGIYIEQGNTTCNASLIANNATEFNTYDGGGIFANLSDLTLINSTFSGNSANLGAGLFQSGGTLDINSSTFANNSATTGGDAIYLQNGTFESYNTIYNNSVENDGSVVISNGYNLVFDASLASDFTQSSDLNSVDPVIGSLDDNGGKTYTHALLCGSPAIGSGDVLNTLKDQRDSLAVGLRDRGAYEFPMVDGSFPVITGTTGNTICYSGTVVLSATANMGYVNWFTVASGGKVFDTGSTITTPIISTTTTYYAQAMNGTCEGTSTTAVVATVNNDCATQLASASCGKQMSLMTEALYSDAVAGASNYRYLVENAASGFSKVATRAASDNLLRLSWLAGPENNTTYTVKVAAYVGGVWQSYGSACSVTTPLVTKLTSASCGISISTMSAALYSETVSGATNYRYEIRKQSDNSLQGVSVRGTNDNLFRLSWFLASQYNSTYSIKVAAYVGGVWMPYGTACAITTPTTTKLAAASCNISIPTLATALYSDAVPGATNFRYEVVNVAAGFSKIITRAASDNLCRLSWTSGIQLNTTYTIRVAAYIGGVWTQYGTACTVTTPAAIMANEEVVQEHNNGLSLGEDLILETYPNPNTGSFTVSSNAAGRFKLVNELGQLIQTLEITEENAFQTKVEGLGAGLYFVTGIVGETVLTRKIVVQ